MCFALLLGCSGGGGGGGGGTGSTGGATSPPSTPTVSFSANPANIALGQSTTLMWSSTNASSCTASGEWNGTRATSGSEQHTPSSTGQKDYRLACTGTDGTADGLATVMVEAPPTITSVAVSCSPSTIDVDGTSQCSATVQGTGGFDPSVTWSMISGAGTIDSAGLYRASNATGQATIEAASVQDAVKTGTAIVTVQNPAPQISQLSPQVVRTGYGSEFTLTVKGDGLLMDSVVQVNGANRPTTFVSGNALAVTILASEVGSQGELTIAVMNGAPGGGVSNAATVAVTAETSVANVASLRLEDPDPTHLFGNQPYYLGNITGGSGEDAVAASSSLGVYVVHDPDRHPGNFTVSQVGSPALPGLRIFYGGPAIPGLAFHGVISCDVDGNGVKNIVIYSNVAASDPVGKPGVGTVFIVEDGPALRGIAVLDLNNPSVGITVVRLEGVGASHFFGQSMACGDVTQDGVDDLMVGDRGYGFDPAFNTGPGGVYRFDGRTDFFDLPPDVTNIGPYGALFTRRNGLADGGSGFGSSFPGSQTIAVIGDKNGDGFPDLLIGDVAAQSGGTQKAYVIFGNGNLHGIQFVEDLASYGGATFFTDLSGCDTAGVPCYNSFGMAVAGRGNSLMVGSPLAFITGETAGGGVFVSERPLLNGEVIDIRNAVLASPPHSTNLWNMTASVERMGFTMADGEDARLVGVPGFDGNRGKLTFIRPEGLPGGDIDAASVLRFTLTGELQGDLFSIGLHRGANGAIVVGARSFTNRNPGKAYYIPVGANGSLLF